jgi:hypothetical protein
MVFCGKCGLQLSAGDTVCPRCGTPTDPDLMPDQSYANNPTIAAGATYAPEKTQPNTQGPARPGRPTPAQQQPLILGPDGTTYAPDPQMANQATTMGSQPYGMPGQTPPGAAYPGYVPQSAGNYPTQSPSYPGFAAQGTPYYQAPQGPYGTSPAEAARTRARGRVVGLLLILLGLLLILGAMVLFLVTHSNSANTSLHAASFLIASLVQMSQSPI